MSDQARALPPGSVKDRQISGQAKIGHGKLAQVADAQVLVGGANKKLSAQTVSGDATLANDGTLTLDDTKLETRVKAVLTKLDIEAGSQKNIKASEIKKIYEEIPGVNQFTNQYSNDLRFAGDANTGSTLVKRDSSGDIAVGTVTGDLTGTATNADKLDNQDGSYYTDVDNHTYPAATTTTVDSNETTTTKRVHEVVEFVPSSNYGTSNYPITFEHLMPYIPDVSVFILESNEYHEVDAKVKATAADGNTAGTVSVDVSETGLNLKVIAS